MIRNRLYTLFVIALLLVMVAGCGPDPAQTGTDRPVITTANAAQVIELEPIPRSTDWVFKISWSADDAYLYVASQGQGTHVWDVMTGDDIGELPFGEAFAVDPTGNYIAGAAGRDTLAILQTDRMELLHEVDIRNWARAVAFAPDGLTFATGHQVNGWNSRMGTSLFLWDVPSGAIIRAYDHTENVDTITISPDGTLIAAAGEDEFINVWNVETGEHIATMSEPDVLVAAIAFSPDNTLLAAASGPGGKVTLWDVASGQIARVLREDGEFSSSVAFSTDGSILASGSRDGTMQLWDVATGAEIALYEMEVVNQTLSLLRTNTVAFNHAGTLIAAGMSDGSVRLFGIPVE